MNEIDNNYESRSKKLLDLYPDIDLKKINTIFSNEDKAYILKKLTLDESITKTIDTAKKIRGISISLRNAQMIVKDIGGKERAIGIAKFFPLKNDPLMEQNKEIRELRESYEKLQSENYKFQKWSLIFIAILLVIIVILAIPDWIDFISLRS